MVSTNSEKFHNIFKIVDSNSYVWKNWLIFNYKFETYTFGKITVPYTVNTSKFESATSESQN